MLPVDTTAAIIRTMRGAYALSMMLKERRTIYTFFEIQELELATT